MVSNMCEMQGETWRLVCTPKQLIGIYLLTTLHCKRYFYRDFALH